MIRFVLAATLALLVSPVLAAVDVQEVKTPGGLTAWLVEEHSIPFAAIEIRFRGGTALDAPDKRGAVNLMAATLEEGSGEMDSQAYSAAREDLSTSIRFDASIDAVTVSFRFLTETRDEAAALLKQALVDPTFPPDAVERVRAQVLSGLRSDATDPGTIASNEFDRLAWGDHPYGSDGSGTVESVTALTRDDLIEAKDRTIARDRVFVGAVGDITPEQLATLLDEVLGELPATGAPQAPEAVWQMAPGLHLVPFDTPQSVAIFGHEGIMRDDPDFFPAYVANEIFGGRGFDSRLTQEIRVKRGLTYGIGTYLAALDHGAYTAGQVATVADRMAETLDLVRAEWAKIAAEGVTEDELAQAKLYLTGAYPLRFDGNATIANILVGMQMDDLPIDYIETRNDKIEAVTLEDVKRVAARIFRPEDLGIVVVGQAGSLPEAQDQPAN